MEVSTEADDQTEICVPNMESEASQPNVLEPESDCCLRTYVAFHRKDSGLNWREVMFEQT